MLNHIAAIIGIGVGIAGLLFLLFQEERQRVPPHTNRNPAPRDVSDYLGNSTISNGNPSLEDVSCVICLDADNLSPSTLTYLRCSHRFHRQCINKWLAEGQGCPLCRSG